jgi:hypothetical protein
MSDTFLLAAYRNPDALCTSEAFSIGWTSGARAVLAKCDIRVRGVLAKCDIRSRVVLGKYDIEPYV